MQPLFRAAAIAALALPLAFAPADAQNYRGAWTLYGGGSWFSDFNDNGDFDFDELDNEVNVFDEDRDAFADLTLDPGWIAGTQLEYWFGNGRFGIRGNGAYTERSFKLEDVIPNEVDVDFGDVNTWFLNGDLMARIMSPGPTRVWAPYVALGAGVVNYNPAGDVPIVLPAANAVFGDFALDNGDDDEGGNGETEFAIDFGLGADVLPGWTFGGLFGLFRDMGVGLRFEVMDHYTFDSPAEPLFAIEDGELVESDDDFDGVHNIRFTAGTMLTFGRLFEEEVAVAPPPAPPAPPEPEEEMLSICVVDPTLPGRVGYVDAVYMPSTGDTLAVRNGDRVDFDREYPNRPPLYAGEANWFVGGEPITLSLADREMEFVSFGGSRIIQPEELTWIGNYRGTPVFAESGEVAAIDDDLEDALEMDDDLEDVLEERAELRDAIGDLDVVYAPVEPGCVFQPFRMVEEVRKVRG